MSLFCFSIKRSKTSFSKTCAKLNILRLCATALRTYHMTLIVRYVTIKNSIAQGKESFLNFFSLSGKTAAEFSQSILDELELNNLDEMMCREQGYGNASSMSGIYLGVQQTIKNIIQKHYSYRGEITL